MLRIGSPISYKIPSLTQVKLLEFDIAKLDWSSKLHETKNMIIETAPFARGGFRAVYKARPQMIIKNMW
jgi:hypothetical protein